MPEEARLPKLFFDEDMSAIVAARLRKDGWDILTTHAARRCQQSDESQVIFASEQRRVLVTRNHVHFLRVHSEWLKERKRHCGIIISLWRPSAEAMTTKLVQVLESVDPNSWDNLFLYA